MECNECCLKPGGISAAWSAAALPSAWNGLGVPVEWHRLGSPGSEVENPSTPPPNRVLRPSCSTLEITWEAEPGGKRRQVLSRQQGYVMQERPGRACAAGLCALSRPGHLPTSREPRCDAAGRRRGCSAATRLPGGLKAVSPSRPATAGRRDGHFSFRVCLRNRATSYSRGDDGKP